MVGLARTAGPIFGRESDVTALVGLLRGGARLITLVGPGGVGKTGLALAAADRLETRFVDGIELVNLAEIADPAGVLGAVAQAVGLAADPGLPLRDQLRRAVEGRQLLLVLDGFEQVLAAAAEVAELLRSRGLQVLVTSRTPLHIAGEREFRVEPLACPPPGARLSRPALTNSPGVAIFMQRAREVVPGFEPTATQMEAIVEICRRLEGLPLALELAAARLKEFSPGDLLARLDRPLSVLIDSRGDGPPRQHSLRSSVEWSYQLISPSEAELFNRLAIFPGDFSEEAAARVGAAGASDPGDFQESVDRLVDHSLVRRATLGGAVRLSMLGVMREFGREQLEARGELAQVQEALAGFFLELVQEAGSQLDAGPEEAWLELLEVERYNLWAAVRWYLDSGQAEKALWMVAGTGRFLLIRTDLEESRQELDRILKAAGDTSSLPRAMVLKAAGELARAQADFQMADQLFAEALTLYRALDHAEGTADVLLLMGIRARDRGDNVAAHRQLQEALAIYESLGSQRGIAQTLLQLAALFWYEEDEARAQSHAERGLRIMRTLDRPWDTARMLLLLGNMTLFRGDDRRAEPDLREAAATFRRLGDRTRTAMALYSLGFMEMKRGNPAAAQGLHLESLGIRVKLREGYFTATSLDGLAMVAAAQKRLDDAALLLNAATHLYQTVGVERSRRLDEELRPVRETIRKGLHPRTLLSAARKGKSVSPSDLWAQEASRQRKANVAAHPDTLTPRELEVLRLLAAGLSSREIARRLFLSLRTVHAHLRSIYLKLGVTSRTAAVRSAGLRGLIDRLPTL